MKFTIQHLTENDLALIRLTDHTSQTFVDVLPDYGALLHAFSVKTKTGVLNIIDNYSGREAVEKELSTSFKSSKLSPFVCRIPRGKYEWQGEQYEFRTKFMDGSAIHGLVYNKAFKVADEHTDDEHASLRLKYHYKKDDEGYPFEYNCEVQYILKEGNLLQVETKVLNLSDDPIPLADGWHPYFTLGAKINDCELQIASEKMLEFNDKLIPTGKFVHEPSFSEAALLGDRFLDNCFELEFSEGAPVCSLHNPQNNVNLLFFTNSNYPYLQLYTPDHRQSIAIENLSGAPDCFNNGMGIKILRPRNTETFNVWYKVQVD